MPVRYQDREISLKDLIRDCTIHGSDSQTSSRHTSAKNGKGRYRSGTGAQQDQTSHIDFPGTIRAAAPWQPARQGKEGRDTLSKGNKEIAAHQIETDSSDALCLKKEQIRKNTTKGRTPAVRLEQQDLRFRHETGTESVSVLFVVDASRSQGAKKRLSFAKGAICHLLRQVYCERYRAGLIVFGNRQATLALPFTRSVEYAAKQLESLPASGNTPLAMGLRLAIHTILTQKQKNESETILLILLTDGKGNYDEWPGDPLTLSEEAASQIRQMDIPAIVIDTETGPFRLGLAKQLAETMNAKYLTL